MRNYINYLVVIGSAATTVGVHALSLSDALQTAEKNSPRVQRAASVKVESGWHKVESYSGYLPTISGSINYLPGHKYVLTDIALPGSPVEVSIPGIVPTTTYSLNAQLGLFDGFASTNRISAAKSLERAAGEQLSWTEFEVQREVALNFYRAVAATELKAVANSNLKTLQDHLHDAKLLKSSGLSTNYDVLRVEVQVSEATSEVLNVSDNVETANGKLGELLGLDTEPDPQGKLPELPATLADQINPRESERRDLTAMRDQIEALQYQKKANSVHWVPRVGLIANYQYYNNRNDRIDEWGSFRNAYEAGVNLTWNLFEGFSSEAKNREILEQRTQSEKSLRIAQLKAVQDAALWTRKFKYFCSVYKARQGDIGKAQESVRLAREGHRVGSRTNTDLLDAETDLYRSQAGAINAQLGQIEALINLELATGKKLYEFN